MNKSLHYVSSCRQRRLLSVFAAVLLLLGMSWLLAGCSFGGETPVPTFTFAVLERSTSDVSPYATDTTTGVLVDTPTANITSASTSTATASAEPTNTPPATPTGTPTPSATAPPPPTATATETPMPIPTDTATPTPVPTPTDPPPPPTATPVPLIQLPPPPGRQFATLEDFWNGSAEWILEVPDTGLPMGESDTVYRGGTEFWSYLHASHQSAGVVDQCGDPVPFPGCTTLWKSTDGGQHFALENPVCLFPCAACPCDHSRDHIGQQQYPRVFFAPDQAYLVYEFGAYVFLRTSTDGVNWSPQAHVPGTWIWWYHNGPCGGVEEIGAHPHIYPELEYNCLVGGPPGIFVEGNLLYVFVALGRAPGHMGCFVGNRYNGAWGLGKCASNPLFGAELGYGPADALGPAGNPYFEFRTISSADVVRVGQHYYMTYEGVRGPSDPSVPDDQFGLGLARSVGPAIDGPWEKYPGNPIIMDLPANIGVGHADIVIVGDATYLYTTTPSLTRARYVLVYR